LKIIVNAFPQYLKPLRIDVIQYRLVEAAASIGMRTAFYRKPGRVILWIGTLHQMADRTGVIPYLKDNVVNPGILLEALQGN
jgi:hypothetical protein